MNCFSKIRNKLIFIYRRYILREPFLLQISRWFKDKGDETLRLDYPLTQESIVFDVGGYNGDFAAELSNRFDCKIYIFEPVTEFYQRCVTRFQNNTKITCFNFGLSSTNGWLNIGLAENASSFSSPHAKGVTQKVQIRSIVECIQELDILKIDLMKINIEGGEFDVLPAIIKSGDIAKIHYLQLQFHNFVNNANVLRADIRNQLEHTHSEMWNYEFVWESWKLKVASLE